jgi:hypothetical protein
MRSVRARTAPLRGLLLAGAASLLLVGCGEKDPIVGLLDELETAAEARSASDFAQCLSEGFRAPGIQGRAQARSTLHRYFAAYKTIDVDYYDVQVEGGEAAASVSLVAEFSGDARRIGGLSGFLPPAAVYRFDLGLTEEAGEWMVANATWESLPPPGPPE